MTPTLRANGNPLVADELLLQGTVQELIREILPKSPICPSLATFAERIWPALNSRLVFLVLNNAGSQMRPIVPPLPSSRCKCGGELRLKRIESAYENLRVEPGYSIGKQAGVFVCTRCSREQKIIIDANPYAAIAAF